MSDTRPESAEVSPAERWFRLARQDLDALDPWVIDGRYAADLPDVGRIEASDLVDAAAGVVQQIRPLVHP